MEFNVTINAPREKVWEILWGETTYPVWTYFFSETSSVETDWKKGSKVLFLDAGKQGMVSFIEDLIPNEFMSFKHMGIVKDGVEDMESAESKEWRGSLENYTLRDDDGKTHLTVTLTDAVIPKEYLDHFMKAWPKALDKVKELAEQGS